MKKVLLVVIDALASRVVVPALERGRLPCFSALIDHGVLRTECTSVFPSITPAATASIATGVYPTDHGIAGAFWYDRDKDFVAYYGDDFWVILNEGIDNFFNDFLVRLNHDRLQAETLYQRIERRGLTTAAVNYMWFRGETVHPVNAPVLLKLLPGINFAPDVRGPKVLALADFASSKIPGHDRQLQADGGLPRRFGFHDETTAEYLMQLAAADPFPDFSLAYFPNNDFDSHQQGPAQALATLAQVDAHLGQFFDTRGGIEQFLKESAVIICGDHSQCDLTGDQNERGIDLDEALKEFSRAAAGQPWEQGDELMICPNMRSCQIYFRDHSSSVRDRTIERLLKDPRVDQVFWRDSSWNSRATDETVDPRSDVFHVDTASHGWLTFRHAASDDKSCGHDDYGTGWIWEGDLECVDARQVGDGRLQYGDYPNALERIATGFCDQSADLWVTARSGYEFRISETSVNNSGSHGALNKDDSTTPLIVSGVPSDVMISKFPRTIDVAPLCLQVLGLHEEAEDLIASRIAGPPK